MPIVGTGASFIALAFLRRSPPFRLSPSGHQFVFWCSVTPNFRPTTIGTKISLPTDCQYMHFEPPLQGLSLLVTDVTDVTILVPVNLNGRSWIFWGDRHCVWVTGSCDPFCLPHTFFASFRTYVSFLSLSIYVSLFCLSFFCILSSFVVFLSFQVWIRILFSIYALPFCFLYLHVSTKNVPLVFRFISIKLCIFTLCF